MMRALTAESRAQACSWALAIFGSCHREASSWRVIAKAFRCCLPIDFQTVFAGRSWRIVTQINRE